VGGGGWGGGFWGLFGLLVVGGWLGGVVKIFFGRRQGARGQGILGGGDGGSERDDRGKSKEGLARFEARH